jgi:hypothetical protein
MNRWWSLVAAGIVVVGVTAPPAAAQSLPVGDVLEDYVRFLQLTGDVPLSSFAVRPGVPAAWLNDSTGPWTGWRYWSGTGRVGPVEYGIAPLEVQGFTNSDHPVSRNDGLLWQGKGVSALASAGGFVRVGPLRVTFRPQLAYAQNLAFPLLPPANTTLSPLSDPWYGRALDRPQRFGSTAFWDASLGQSTAEIEYRGFTAGVGTENMWWGPGIANGIVMSNSAPGFPHAFVGTTRPVKVGIGSLEFRWMWGRLHESAYYDTDPANDTRYVTGLVAAFQPKPIPGLFVGGSRLFYRLTPPGGMPFSEYLLVFQGLFKASQETPDNPSGNDLRDQLVSLFARWVFPASALEIYGEWARNDHAQNLRDFVLQPEHATGYTTGLQKAFPAWVETRLKVAAEFTHLERAKTLLDRPTPTFYVHTRVTHGYTHLGQLVGAAVGPGGDQQSLSGDLYAPWGGVGLFLIRQVHDNDTYYRLRASGAIDGIRRNDVEVSVGARGRLLLGGLEVSGALEWGRELNRYYVAGNDVTNLHAELGARWRMR